MDDRWHEDLQEQVRQEACERGTAGRITVSQQQVLRLLEQGDDRLHQVLSTLHRQLRIWQCLDDHATSERDAVLTGDTKAERMLAAAVCDVMDALTEDTIDTSADHLAHMIQAEVDSETAAYRSPAKVRLMRLQSCIHGWLDDAPDQQASPQAKREAMAHQLAKHLEPMGPLVAKAGPAASGKYVAQMLHALQVWMSGKPAGAQMLANAVVALPDVLEPQEVAQ